MTIILCSQSLTRHRGPILPLDLNQQGQPPSRTTQAEKRDKLTCIIDKIAHFPQPRPAVLGIFGTTLFSQSAFTAHSPSHINNYTQLY